MHIIFLFNLEHTKNRVKKWPTFVNALQQPECGSDLHMWRFADWCDIGWFSAFDQYCIGYLHFRQAAISSSAGGRIWTWSE